MKRAALLFCLAGLSGCSTDSAHSLSRDYRSLNNEAIDALMMATTEQRAQIAKTKILKSYSDRLQAIDKRFATWVQNTDDKVIVLDTFTDESVPTLLAEIEVNRKRLDVELGRLKKLVDAKAKEGIDVRKECPALTDLAGGNAVNQLKTQLTGGNKFVDLVKNIRDKNNKQWNGNKPPNFDDLDKQLDARVKAMSL